MGHRIAHVGPSWTGPRTQASHRNPRGRLANGHRAGPVGRGVVSKGRGGKKQEAAMDTLLRIIRAAMGWEIVCGGDGGSSTILAHAAAGHAP